MTTPTAVQTPESGPEIPTTAEGLDARGAAKSIVAAALESAREAGITPPVAPEPGVPPVEPAPIVPQPSEALPPIQPAPPVEPVQPVEPVPEVTPEVAAAVADEAGVPYTEAVQALAEMGIAVETEGIPTELHERFGEILQSVKAAVDPTLEVTDKQRAQLKRLHAFEQRLDQKPESVLLTLMIKKPEAFQRVMEVAERAKDDPDYRAQVVKEVELEARESHLNARESTQTEREIERQGRLAEAATNAAAKRHGVDPDVADRYIAGMIGASGRDAFDISGIDEYVKQLRPKAAPAPPTPRVMTPAAAAAVLETPTAPVGGDAPPAPPGTSSGLTTEVTQPQRGGTVRGLIRAAAQRVDGLTSRE